MSVIECRDYWPRWRALVHDDNEQAGMILAEMVEHLGWFCEVTHGRHDFKHAINRSINVVFLDIYSPELDAPEALCLLQNSGFQGAVCIMTGGQPHTLETIAHLAAASRLTVLAKLRKPIDFKVIQSILTHDFESRASFSSARNALI